MWSGLGFPLENIMGFIRHWLDRRLAAEHEKLIDQCRTQSGKMLALMGAAYTNEPEIANTISVLNNFRTNLDRLKFRLRMEGKLPAKDADYLLAELRDLNRVETTYLKAYRKNR